MTVKALKAGQVALDPDSSGMPRLRGWYGFRFKFLKLLNGVGEFAQPIRFDLHNIARCQR